MKINHAQALRIENILENMFKCKRSAVGGLIDADHFETEPFDAALLAIGFLWGKIEYINEEQEIDEFIVKWKNLRNQNQAEPIDVN